MSILKAEVLTVVNERLGRAETSIDTELLSALYDISTRGNFILVTSDQTLTVGDEDYNFPTGMKQLLNCYITVGKDGKRTEPLTKMPWAGYLTYRADEGTSDRDEPEYYAIHNEIIYPYPVPDATYTLRMYYAIYHPNTVATISFGEPFRESVYQMTMVKVCEKFQLWDDAKAF